MTLPDTPSSQPPLPARQPAGEVTRIAVLVLPSCNAMATMALLDPFRAANYLNARVRYRWQLVAVNGATVTASNGLVLAEATPLAAAGEDFDLLLVSARWTPELYRESRVLRWLRACARRGAVLGGIDTGAFLLAWAGLLDGRRVTVHYEHISAFRETFPTIAVCEDLYTIDGDRVSCCGGTAASDLALELIRLRDGIEIANAAARYIFHDRLRDGAEGQFPIHHEPVGYAAPAKLRHAIVCMERNLENPLSLADVAREAGTSLRQLERLFRAHTGVTPVRYYLGSRLDRARGMVTQTDIPLLEVAVACGFSSQEHFARSYRQRFGLQPSRDRGEGRVPFQFRSFPSHRGTR
jgi:AraC family carnitine catabolism transcriptional activator